MFLGIEIGGTKLQLGVGEDVGTLDGLWRGTIDPAAGPNGIRRQIVAGVPELLTSAGLGKCHLHGVGVGFGGPVDDDTRTVVKSHQIEGWDGFALAEWIADIVGVPAVLGNDADVAGLAEALHGAGKGMSPIFYITVGSGIGGGFVIDGEIQRGCGKGAAEIGHLLVREGTSLVPLERAASGWALDRKARAVLQRDDVDARELARLARDGNAVARSAIDESLAALAEAICHVIALICPRRIIVGGGVPLMGDELFFNPLRAMVERAVFRPFAGLTEIVPAALGEEVVVHGAIALARKAFGRK